MQNIPGDITEMQQQKKGGFTPRELFLKYIRFLPWLVLSIAATLLFAYIMLRYSVPIYNINAKLLVKSNSQSGAEGEKFDDIFMMQGMRANMNDEIEVIKSRYMAKRVISKLNFQYTYSNKGQFRSSVIHPRDMPFLARVQLYDSSAGATIAVKVSENSSYFTIGESTEKYYFGQWCKIGNNQWFLYRTSRDFTSLASREFVISWSPLEAISASLSGSIKVVRADNFSNVLNLSYQTPNTSIGADILNKYMEEYQQFSLEDKRQIAINTLEFIDSQLDTVKRELGFVEKNLKDFREKNRIIDPDGQARLYLDNINESSKVITEQYVKVKVADQLINYINDQKNPFRLVPTSLGIVEPALIQQITEYNRLLMQRESLLLTTPEENPLVRDIENSISKLRADMLDNLRNIRRSYDASIVDYEKNNKLSEEKVRLVPGVQKTLLEIGRQQKILEELYSYLLQKKLETSIGSASTISNIRVVENAYFSTRPVHPDRRSIYLLSLFVGILLPAIVIFLMEYLNDRVQTKNDVQRVTDAPILGEVGHSDDSQALVVGKNSRKVVAEQFRMIRTNLQYILRSKDKSVIMVTSSYSGEGKSFISTNIAAVIALTGKKTVILEFDIRKPKIVHGLSLKRSHGITNYVIGSCSLEELPIPVPNFENLYVISCGPVPPNPAELLLDPRIKNLFDYVKEKFDVVIIDTAPVGLVSDAITLGKYADATVYIVRHNYTQKRQIQLIQDLYVQEKLPSMSVIINDIKAKLGYGGYYGYGGYGYGYGYGYGGRTSRNQDASAYYGIEEQPASWLSRWLQRKGAKK
jgi:capsular exopolysaccharide synthesis family protein